MFKLYYAAAIDTCVDKAFKQIEEFKEIFDKYQKHSDVSYTRNPIKVYGAGFGDSPIIGPETSPVKKGVISSYDLRVIRDCDVFLLVTNLEDFAAGTFMELEHARQHGIYTIVLVLGNKKIKNIFVETFANKIIYSIEELEEILRDLTQ